ncbi:hypothetical protein SLA2020_395040 [Shorea laevis]
MIWVVALQVNAAMTDPKLLSEANLGCKAEVGAATDASNAAAVVPSSTHDGAADDDTNPDSGKYNSSDSDPSSHHKYTGSDKPKNWP